MKYENINVGIIGLGFLGGSLAKSLKKLDCVKEILALDKNEKSLKEAMTDGVINDYTLDINSKFSKCDVVFICTPVSYIFDYIVQLKDVVKNECIITDTGSTKKTIIEKVKNVDVNFIGGHPMVGSERSGYKTSKEFLFENAYYIITKGDKTTKNAVDTLEFLVKSIKALPIIIDENKHDYITASISHLPHLVAYSLVSTVKDSDDDEEHMKTLAAGGFKDITRIASSDPTMWENICFENKDEILKLIDKFMKKMEYVREKVKKKSSLYDYFEEQKNYRDSFINRKISGNVMPEINVSVKDENGAIAIIVTLLAVNNIGLRNIEVINNRESNYGALRIVINNFEERDKAYELLKNKGYDLIKIN